MATVDSLYWANAAGVKQDKGGQRPAMMDMQEWLALQCALLCVNSKLRTVLGKPQDTFLTIEGILSFF